VAGPAARALHTALLLLLPLLLRLLCRLGLRGRPDSDFCSAFQLQSGRLPKDLISIQQALSCFQCAYARLLAMSPQCHALQVLHISSRHGQSLNRLNCISNRAASPHGRDSSSLRWPSLRKSGQILVSPPGHPPLDVTFLFLDQLALLLIFSRERALSR
jgi:hypothetical protein